MNSECILHVLLNPREIELKQLCSKLSLSLPTPVQAPLTGILQWFPHSTSDLKLPLVRQLVGYNLYSWGQSSTGFLY